MNDLGFIQGLPSLVAEWVPLLAYAMPGGAPTRDLPLPGLPKPNRRPPYKFRFNRMFWLDLFLRQFIPYQNEPGSVTVPDATKICDGTHGFPLSAPTKQQTQVSCSTSAVCGQSCQNVAAAANFGSTWNPGNFSRGLVLFSPSLDPSADCGTALPRWHVHSVWGYCGPLPHPMTPTQNPTRRMWNPNEKWDPPTNFARPPALPGPNIRVGRPMPRFRPRPRVPGRPWIDPAPFEPPTPPSPPPRPRTRPRVRFPRENEAPFDDFDFGQEPPDPIPWGQFPRGPVRFPPGINRPRPPGAGTKERKVLSPYLYRLLRFYHEAGEALDIVDCLYDALPKDAKAKTPRYQNKKGEWVNGKITTKSKMKAIYNNFDKPGLDMGGLTKCLIANEIEDQIVGRIMSGSAGAIQFIGRGLGWGPAV